MEVITQDSTFITLEEINIGVVSDIKSCFKTFEQLAEWVYNYYNSVKESPVDCHHNNYSTTKNCTKRGTKDEGTLIWKYTTVESALQKVNAKFKWPIKQNKKAAGNPSADRLAYVARIHILLGAPHENKVELEYAKCWLKQNKGQHRAKSNTMYEIRHLCGCVCNNLKHLKCGPWKVNEDDKHFHFFFRKVKSTQDYNDIVIFLQRLSGDFDVF